MLSSFLFFFQLSVQKLTTYETKLLKYIYIYMSKTFLGVKIFTKTNAKKATSTIT